MRVLMTGGGTGGHVNPALAIAATILENEPDSEIAYVGTSRGIENKLVPRAGYKLYHVDVQGIKRSLSISNIKSLYLALTSPQKAKKIIREFSPDIVIGTGGYVSWPVVKAAAKMHIPAVLHESNAIPGMAVKALEGSVDRIYLNFEKTADSLKHKEKLLHVGNPLRTGFKTISREEARAALNIPSEYKYVLLSFGGSLGAEKLNEAALRIMEEIVRTSPDIYYIHASGSGGYTEMKREFEVRGLDKCQNISLREYIFDMPYCIASADLSINRAGAMTVSELAMAARASIFIPSPNVTDNHQYKNAKVLADANAAAIITEQDIAEKLIPTVSRLLSSEGDAMRAEMETNIKQFAVSDANKRIYLDIKKLINSK